MLLSVHHLAWPESFEGSPSCLCNGASSRLHESQTVLVVKEYPTARNKEDSDHMVLLQQQWLLGKECKQHCSHSVVAARLNCLRKSFLHVILIENN